MRIISTAWVASAVALGVLAQGLAHSAEVAWLRRKPCRPPCLPFTPPESQPSPKPPEPGPPIDPPQRDAFASSGEGGMMGPASFEPGMFGDLTGFSAIRVVFFQDQFVPTPAPSPALSGGMKVAEYESPRPTDRLFYNFNSFSFVNAWNPGSPPMHLARHVLGFEKALRAGNASVGLRLPVVNLYGSAALNESQFGNLSVILKYALINRGPGGDVLSGGLVLTPPTGQGVLADFMSNSNEPAVTRTTIIATYFQPYVAFIRYLRRRLFVHGFTAVLTPSDGRLVTLWANDIGVVAVFERQYREGFIRGVMPTLEVHVNTPLNHRGLQSQPIGFVNNVNLTAGCSFLMPRGILGWAIGTPIMGPRPFTTETIATMNFRY